METRALIRGAPRRTLHAAVLLAVLIAALLGGWFVSGWADVRARQAETREAPGKEASQRAGELARELRGELEALFGREAARPYYHYQNLFHDPKGSPGPSVTPSPLANGPEDPLVLGYFQLDASSHVTTPSINEDVPELSEQSGLVEHRVFCDTVVRDLARDLSPAKAPAAKDSHVYQIDSSSYAQNLESNALWGGHGTNRLEAGTPEHAPPSTGPVTITVSPLEWRTLPFDGAPALVAVRQVQTPDGAFAQGFVVDRATVTSRLAAHAGSLVATLATGDLGVEIVPGWQLAVAPNPRALAEAAVAATAIARTFLIRFIASGLVALVAAAFVVLLVARAEKLARERSRFAAAAAHELRTPLAGLQLYGDMLADGLGDPDKLHDYARRMSEEASRLGRVVSNVLGFSQLERGNLSVDPQVGALGEALRELVDRVEPTLDRAGAALELDVAPELRAKFDRDGLARIVGNLLDNAEKYARQADDRTIRLAATDRGDFVEVVVIDRGPGVADHTQLFEPFSRGVTADGPAGLGLGLALSQSLARAMGGELSYRRADGGGAAFALRLPRA